MFSEEVCWCRHTCCYQTTWFWECLGDCDCHIEEEDDEEDTLGISYWDTFGD